MFSAKVCYGMHAPWWVVQTMRGEADPEPMNDDDEWIESSVVLHLLSVGADTITPKNVHSSEDTK